MTSSNRCTSRPGNAGHVVGVAPTRMTVRKCGSRSMIGQIVCASGAATTSAVRAAVGEDIGVLRHVEEGVERDRDGAGADRAPERHRIIDRVVQQQRDALLLPHARAPASALAKRTLRVCRSP